MSLTHDLMADIDGWQPRVLACNVCDPDRPHADCWACNGTGLHACSGHVVYDALVVDGDLLATIEAFDDVGPFYVNAAGPAGDHQRRVMINHAAAATWAEVVTGYRVARPPNKGG